MSVAKAALLAVCLAVYGLLFSYTEQAAANRPYDLSPVLPPAMQQIGLGYLHQLGGDIAYIQASVFHGGLPGGVDPESYADRLSDYYRAMQALQPRLLDIYYKCQSHLAHLGGDRTRFVNRVLENGLATNPDAWLLPYFAAFNHFYYLDEPLKAVKLLRQTIDIRGYPGMLQKLISILLARGGDIYGGLIMLKSMQSQEDDPQMKQRYQSEIDVYEQAWQVFLAIEAYHKQHGAYPQSLDELVPDTLAEFPDLGESDYILSYSDHRLKLLRKDTKKH